MNKTSEAWVVRVNIGGVWHDATHDDGRTIRASGKTGFRRACKLATAEGEAMRWAHMTAVVQERDKGCPMLHRLACESFTL